MFSQLVQCTLDSSLYTRIYDTHLSPATSIRVINLLDTKPALWEILRYITLGHEQFPQRIRVCGARKPKRDADDSNGLLGRRVLHVLHDDSARNLDSREKKRLSRSRICLVTEKKVFLARQGSVHTEVGN